MKISKYPFAVLSAALFTVMLVTPITSISNLIWLSSVDMPVTFITSLEVILFLSQSFHPLNFAFSEGFSEIGLLDQGSKYRSTCRTLKRSSWRIFWS